ncbi:hypothetical protein B0T20DRAFT_421844 [Sordaria brevicollis]|uniref:Uncharacterized protein n=1 Tax=Sordaria brevicollis TaxID=83679 RepID=A0AAE0U6W8_SORBR|nr:hypothetical protein B0T20DRAFT_421844 [Sordaria brevicollis]
MRSQHSITPISQDVHGHPYNFSVITVEEVILTGPSPAHSSPDVGETLAGNRGGPRSSQLVVLPATPNVERSTLIPQKIQEFFKPRNTLVSAEYPHGLNYPEFKGFKTSIATSIQWLEQKMSTDDNPGVMDYLREHRVIEGLKMEFQRVMKEAEFFFQRGIVRSLISSKQQVAFLSATLFQLRATVALVVALLRLEDAVTTTVDDNENNNLGSDDRSTSDTSCGSSVRSTVRSFDSSRSFRTINSIRVANLQLEM